MYFITKRIPFLILCIFLLPRITLAVGLLKVSFLDVGQGDSIYIESPNQKQLIIDGGKKGSVINSLSKVMPRFDDDIDVVIATHPDADHIGGLIDIFSKYKIKSFIDPGKVSKTKTYKNLMNYIYKNNIPYVVGSFGTKIILDQDNNIYFEILSPYTDVSKMKDTNTASIVGILYYGKTKFLFTGDAPSFVEDMLVSTYKNSLKSTVLKLGHHGSRTSSSTIFLQTVDPEIAIISSGKNNTYGHPHKEVLYRLNNLNIPYLNTSDKGTINCLSDGLVVSCK